MVNIFLFSLPFRKGWSRLLPRSVEIAIKTNGFLKVFWNPFLARLRVLLSIGFSKLGNLQKSNENQWIFDIAKKRFLRSLQNPVFQFREKQKQMVFHIFAEISVLWHLGLGRFFLKLAPRGQLKRNPCCRSNSIKTNAFLTKRLYSSS